MFSHTKKVGSLGRYGTRVGRKLRNEAVKIEVEAKKKSKCPSCARGKLRRTKSGVWECKTCSHTFTAGSHVASVRKIVSSEVNQVK